MSGILPAKAAALLVERQVMRKDWGGKVALGLVFPGPFQVAVSDRDFLATYRHLNYRPQVVCERVVLPEVEDLRGYGRARTPLRSMESQRPLTDFDLVAFSVSAERDYIAILQLLELAGIPPFAAERGGAHPALLMGGPLASGNPEPLADIFDLVLVGEGEEGWMEVLEGYREIRDAEGPGTRKGAFLRRILPLEGVYVPCFYDVSYHPDGRVAAVRSQEGAPPTVGAPGREPVSGAEPVDRPGGQLVTLAPRAGTERLRRVVGVQMTDEELFRRAAEAVHGGIARLKLDFTIGFPTEAEQDIAAIPALIKRVRHHMLQRARHAGRVGEMSVAVSCFIPRPWTRFQWCGFEDVKRLEDKLRLIRGDLARIGTLLVTHDLPRWAYLEALLARGDRRASGLLRLAHAAGGDWTQAFRAWHLNPDFYACRSRPFDEVFPWDHLAVGMTKERLLRERERAGLA